MEIPTVTLSSEAIRNALSELINEFIRIEKSATGVVEYQQRSNFIRGQISLITSFMVKNGTIQNQVKAILTFLKYIVNKYELSGVWRINELS